VRQKSESPEVTQRRVLVVEDEAMLRRTLADTLTDEGFAVRQAPDGRAALELLETWRPRVILLDLLMPVMDGRAFLGELRQRDALADILVIVISATPDKRDLDGAAEFVSKPFELDDVVDLVHRLAGTVATSSSESDSLQA
jgi:CheY-like chemotaxis protein